MGQPTRAELAKQVAELSAKLTAAKTAEETQIAALAALQQSLTRQTELFDAVQVRADAAEAEAQAATTAAAEAQAQADAATAAAAAATTAAATAAAADAPPPPEPIAKPRAQRYNIREAMHLDDQDYLTIRATIHNLVKSAQLNWREDFRHQDPAKLGHLFKAARKEHPVLRRYTGDWATAVITKTYMQNMRKHARRRGYIPPWNSNNASSSQAN